MSERRGVIVDNGVVTNIIVWGEETEQQFSNDGHDRVEETTDWSFQPGIGWTWNPVDSYRPAKTFASWVWNEDSYCWVAPLPRPQGPYWEWDEEGGQWIKDPEVYGFFEQGDKMPDGFTTSVENL